MIFKVEPLYKCLTDVTLNLPPEKFKILLTSPRGNLFDQKEAEHLSLLDNLVIICGHYKGVDERIKSLFPIHEISIGDYVLSGGELAALVIIDAVIRLLPGVLNDMDSAFTDSFTDFLLDCDYYTRPAIFQGKSVPGVLLSGDHKKIETWRKKSKEKITCKNRPDLYKKYLKEIKIR
jgi:tRNA (guanine37-N1)-methyltransferase